MNRRDLFKFAGLGAAALLVPELVLPKTTFFLPPSCGWGAQRLKIRVVQQYLINNDTEPFRYDGTWVKGNGEHVQYHIDMLERNDHIARMMLEDRMNADWGVPNSEQCVLRLPRSTIFGAYI